MANSATWSTGEGDTKKSVMFHVGDTVRVHYKLIEKEKVSGKTKKELSPSQLKLKEDLATMY